MAPTRDTEGGRTCRLPLSAACIVTKQGRAGQKADNTGSTRPVCLPRIRQPEGRAQELLQSGLLTELEIVQDVKNNSRKAGEQQRNETWKTRGQLEEGHGVGQPVCLYNLNLKVP